MPISKWQKFGAVRMSLVKWNRLIAGLTVKAEIGDSQAQWELGSLLDGGLLNARGEAFAVRPDKRAALAWFRCSAQAGNPSGQVCLANYLSGEGPTKPDEKQARVWYRRAARQGDSCAAWNIARMYADRRNQRRAFSWYRKAAAMNDGDALVEVGVRYYEGNGVPRDPRSALRCFRRALQSGNSHITQAGRDLAMYWLGRAYHEGCGTKKSNATALAWLSKANVDGDIPEARKLINEIRRDSKTTANKHVRRKKAS